MCRAWFAVLGEFEIDLVWEPYTCPKNRTIRIVIIPYFGLIITDYVQESPYPV
jgi:hypothetical protein